ncbi:probable hydrolase PNKD [Ptychodera flava]|uniref:probable hydrolase PNKD n=1 Tax=Ptychodera flava TaxID=63121 RepID=UPI003969CF7D
MRPRNNRIMFSLAAFIFLGVGALLFYRRYSAKRSSMATRPGGFLFKIGYFLYTRTRLGYMYHLKNLTKMRQKFPEGHSVVTPVEFQGLKICPIPLLEDNYSYVLIDTTDSVAVVVDPSDAEAVQNFLTEENVKLLGILTTHKHWDHSGGNSTIKSRHRNIPVYGSSSDSIPGLTHPVSDEDRIQIGNFNFTVKFTPGHTRGHSVYILDGTPYSAPDSLFSGDLLFIGGSGRMFEGSPLTMLRSLDTVCHLRDDTLVWPGHEYARDDLKFAMTVEPDNISLQNKLKWVEDKRKERLMTCPSTIGEEKLYNPFLRTSEGKIQQNMGVKIEKDDSEKIRTATLAAVRQSKDSHSYRL